MASGIIGEGLDILLRNGFIQILFFSLIYVVVYAILRSIKLFEGKDEKNASAKKIHGIIALVVAILSILPHYYAPFSSYDIIPILSKALPEISLIALGILCVMLILGIIGIKFGGNDGNPLRILIFALIVIGVIWIFLSSSNKLNLPNWITGEIWAVIIALVVFGAIVAFIMGPDKKRQKYSDLKSKIESNDWKEADLGHALVDLFQKKP